MKYPLLDTYENGKLKECPTCHNEITNIEAAKLILVSRGTFF